MSDKVFKTSPGTCAGGNHGEHEKFLHPNGVWGTCNCAEMVWCLGIKHTLTYARRGKEIPYKLKKFEGEVRKILKEEQDAKKRKILKEEQDAKKREISPEKATENLLGVLARGFNQMTFSGLDVLAKEADEAEAEGAEGEEEDVGALFDTIFYRIK